jgi:hypothetical protein
MTVTRPSFPKILLFKFPFCAAASAAVTVSQLCVAMANAETSGRASSWPALFLAPELVFQPHG